LTVLGELGRDSRAAVGRLAAGFALATLGIAFGWIVVNHPTFVVISTLGVGTAVIGTLALVRLHALPRTSLELLAACAIVLLPVAPYLNTLGPFASGIRIGIAALFVATVVTGASRADTVPRRALFSFTLIVVGAQIIALVESSSATYGVLRFTNWIMFLPLAWIEFDRHARRVLAAFALISGVVLALGVIFQLLGFIGGTWGGLAQTQSTHATRYTSFLLNPNDLGLAMFIAAVIAYFVARESTGIVALGAYVCVGAFGACVLLSASRGALLAIPVVLVYLAARGLRKPMLVLAATLLLGALILSAASPASKRSIGSTVHSIGSAAAGQDASVKQRSDRWKTLIRDTANPLIGGGYGGYGGAATQNVTGSQRHAIYTQLTVDNSWLKLWLEAGALGVIAMGGVFFLGVSRCWSLVRSNDPVVGLVCGSALLALLFRSLSVDLFDINPWNFIIWALIGIAYSPADTVESRES
jgi:hypothetical protein